MMFRLTTAATPAWKLGLIPVLATVLFKVTRTSPGDIDLPPPPVAEKAAKEPQAASLRKPTVLPELSLNDALRFDPFTSLPLTRRLVEEPSSVVESPVAEEASDQIVPPAAPIVNPLVEKAETLRHLKVSAVFPSSTGAMAIIDSKVVRKGDLLSPGVRVVEIRGTDVLLRVEDGETGPAAAGNEAATR